MGAAASETEPPLQMMMDWIADKAFEDTPMDLNYRHLTNPEKQNIDKTIIRVMQTDRRIETKLLSVGLYEPQILDALRW